MTESDRRHLTTLAAIIDPEPWRQAAAALAAVVVRVLRPALRRADLPEATLDRPAEFGLIGHSTNRGWAPVGGRPSPLRKGGVGRDPGRTLL